ncbi:MAG: hypothetical protein K6G84_14830 [Lachnospiraceae bacterium]|nr:hypothetical protein [Lachnospiraceae bacterium]
MGKIVVQKGEKVHAAGEEVSTIDILLKGKIMLVSSDGIKIPVGNGTILGVFHNPNETYLYDYIAEEDSAIYQYDYSSEADIVNTIKNNPNIATAVSVATVRLTKYFFDVLNACHARSKKVYDSMQSDYLQYQKNCAMVGEEPILFESITRLKEPVEPTEGKGWEAEYCKALLNNDAVLRQGFYGADINFCVGTVMMCRSMISRVQKQVEKSSIYIELVKESTHDFTMAKNSIKAKADEIKRQNALSSGNGEVPAIENAIDTILSYSGVDAGTATTFKEQVEMFKSADDRLDSSDEMRRLRRDIAKSFYEVYESAFFKSMEGNPVPPEVRMFFMFGFVDENLAGKENTEQLYKLAMSWIADPKKKVISAYEWLKKIYNKENPPSKNEFDNDWPGYLKEQRRNGDITEEEENAMLNDSKAMTSFELNNMLATANRMTFGTISTFVPIFFKEAALRPLETCLVTPARAHAAIDAVRDIDYSCFYRETVASFPELGINQFVHNVEVEPFIILLPNVGSRASLWQEIEGRKRTTAARMVMSIFHTEDVNDSMVKICGEFRWEMCRRIQGVHWNDVTDPSLTSEYSDYLQFYRKNHEISPDTREKIKNALQKARNNYRGVFVADYEAYIKNEALGQSKLNKVAREMVFKYCTFSKKYREALGSNPQYQTLIERFNIKQQSKEHSLGLIVRKVTSVQEELPEEMQNEVAFIKM